MFAQDCYKRVCIEGPKAHSLRAAASTLQREVRERRQQVALREAAMSTHNPPDFQTVQVGHYGF